MLGSAEPTPIGLAGQADFGATMTRRVVGLAPGFEEAGHAGPGRLHDLSATILRCVGIDHTRLTFKYQGRHFRLMEVFGKVVQKALTFDADSLAPSARSELAVWSGTPTPEAGNLQEDYVDDEGCLHSDRPAHHHVLRPHDRMRFPFF